MILSTLVVLFFALMVVGVPIAFAMAGGSLVALIMQGVPLTIAVQRMYSGADSFTLLAIPFYILAGELMSRGFLTRQLVNFTTKLFGHVPAGTGTVDVVSSMLFSGVSGSGTADMAAIGSILIPRLIQRGYPRGLAAAIECGAGALGPIIPPSLLMIIYAGLAEVSVGRMFLGGIIPGLLTGAGLILVLQVWNRRERWEPASGPRASLKEIGQATRAATLALLMPLIIIGGIVSGVFTAAEAGAVAVAYALVIGLLSRDLNLVQLRQALRSTTMMTIAVMLPVAAATLFGWVLAREQFGTYVVQYLSYLSMGNSLLAALLVIAFIILLGFPIEGLTIMIVFVPILAPLGVALGYDPIHWGVVMVLAINLAGITPPVGGGIFLCSAIARTNVQDTSRYIMPFLAVLTAVTLICLLVPGTITWVPDLIMGPAR